MTRFIKEEKKIIRNGKKIEIKFPNWCPKCGARKDNFEYFSIDCFHCRRCSRIFRWDREKKYWFN